MDNDASRGELLEAATRSHQAGRLEEAAELYDQILRNYPQDPDALHFLGVLLHQRGNSIEAAELIKRSIAQRPQSASAHYNMGAVLEEMCEFGKAAEHYQRAIALNPRYVNALNRLGCMFWDSGKFADAEACFEKALAADPDSPELLSNLGSVLIERSEFERATAVCQKALALRPAFTEAHNNLGRIRLGEGKLAEAAGHFRQALELKPDFIAAANNLGTTLHGMNHFQEAVDTLNAALVKQPDVPEILNNLGNSLLAAGLRKEGVAALQRAVELAPNNSVCHSNLVFTLMFQPEYSSAAILQEGRRWNERHALPLERFRQPHANTRDAERPLRIGYVSPDLRDHVVGRNLVPLFRHHDRRNFIVTCYSNSREEDAITKEIQSHCHAWRKIEGMGDDAVADLIREDQIDILVDLALHVHKNRLTVFARKRAPVQMTFAGYPGTTGVSAIDYRLTDPYLDPPGVGDDLYSETSIRLAHSFWCYDPLGLAVEVNELSAIKNGFVTFGCLNDFSKFNEVVKELWAPIFAALPDSRLVVLAARGRHREEMARTLGLSMQRVIFVEPCERERYLQIYHSVDICLDTFPYNGHTTSLDSYWMGVPVITLAGKTVVSRAGVSHWTNLGYPQFMSWSPESFFRTAVEMSRDISGLATLRRELRGRMMNSPLMDGAGFASSIESAYRNAWKHWCDTG